MIKLTNGDIYEEMLTILVRGNVVRTLQFRHWIRDYPYYDVVSYVIDGPNWAVEEVESREND